MSGVVLGAVGWAAGALSVVLTAVLAGVATGSLTFTGATFASGLASGFVSTLLTAAVGWATVCRIALIDPSTRNKSLCTLLTRSSAESKKRTSCTWLSKPFNSADDLVNKVHNDLFRVL